MPARLAQHLISRGLLSAEALENAQRHRAAHGGTLDTALLEAGALAEPGVLQALADVSGLRPVNLADFEPNPEMARFIPANVAQRLGAVPLSEEAGTLHIACTFPPPTRDLEDVSLLLGRRLELWVAVEARVQDWIALIYGSALAPRFATLLSVLDPDRPAPAPIPLTAPLKADAPPTGSLVEVTTLEDALSIDIVDQIARAVAEEPILLEVRKKPKSEETARLSAEQSRTLQEASRPPAWEREETKPVDPATSRALIAASAQPDPLPPAPFAFEPPAGHPETPEPAPAPMPPEGGWTLDEARAALQASSDDRDRIIEVALHFAMQTFDFAAAFAVVQGQAWGWNAAGEDAAIFFADRPVIPLDASSLFRTVVMTRGSYVGPSPQDPLTRQYLERMGRAPRTLLVYPVEVKDRVVCLLYGDSGSRPVSQRRLSELLLFCQELPLAFRNLLVFRKQRFGAARGSGLTLDELSPSPEPSSAGLGWSPAVPNETHHGNALRRTVSSPGFAISDPIRPPSDFAPLLRKLTGPEASARAAAVAELSRTPEASAKELVRHFPGPTAWSRLPVTDLPEPDELGPIPAALSRLGRPAAQALAPLLDADDADVRYYALLTAGSLVFPELVGGVLRGLFDYEPDIASAARAAATALRRLPRFDTAMRDLRQELAAVDPLRRSMAARVMGVLHDRQSIDGLINLTGSDDALCAQAAAEALREITHASFGTDMRRWSAWWADNRGRTRAEWLIAALKHADADVRLSAIDELSNVTNDHLGYHADDPEPERNAAIARWIEAIAHNPRLARMD